MPHHVCQKSPAYLSLLDVARQAATSVLCPGDSVVDATMGNGHDSLFLASCVGDTGKLYAFDVQQAALCATKNRLKAHGVLHRASLFAAGHEEAEKHLPAGVDFRVVMFNLGFLPGSDKQRVTVARTTLAACALFAARMAQPGLMVIHCYSGHSGGLEESLAVKAWAGALSAPLWRVQALEDLNKAKNRELLILVWQQAHTARQL